MCEMKAIDKKAQTSQILNQMLYNTPLVCLTFVCEIVVDFDFTFSGLKRSEHLYTYNVYITFFYHILIMLT